MESKEKKFTNAVAAYIANTISEEQLKEATDFDSLSPEEKSRWHQAIEVVKETRTFRSYRRGK